MDSLLRHLIRFLLRPLFRSLTGFFHGLDDKRRAFGKRDWLLVNGTVEMCNVQAREDDWVVLLRYSYTADGEFWSGEFYRVFFTENDADGYAIQHPMGSTVVVRYRPGKVSRSAILKEDQLSASAAGSI